MSVKTKEDWREYEEKMLLVAAAVAGGSAAAHITDAKLIAQHSFSVAHELVEIHEQRCRDRGVKT